MKLSGAINDALNEQVHKEYTNSLFYEQIAALFAEKGLKNLFAFFRKQASEEIGHAQKILEYISDRVGGVVSLQVVPLAPNHAQVPTMSLGMIGEAYLNAEEQTTASLESIHELICDENSGIDIPFILEMLNEQVEEESKAYDFAMKAKVVTDEVLFDLTMGE